MNIKKSGFSKRILSMALAMLMVLGMIPATLLAQDQTSGTVEYAGGENTFEDGKIKISKTATKAGENLFKIDLVVESEDEVRSYVSGSDAHVVLVIDTSGSMNSSRMTAAKNAALTFVNTMLGENASEGNQIAIVTYSKGVNKTQALTGNKTTLTSWLNNSQNIPAEGDDGTNTQAGLKKAQEILDADKSDAQKFVVLLSDGYPTYSYQGTKAVKSTNEIPNLSGSYYDFRLTEFNTTIKGGGFYCTLPTKGDGKEYKVQVPDLGEKTVKDNALPTLSQAWLIKENYEIYSVLLMPSSHSDYSVASKVMESIASPDAQGATIKHYISSGDSKDELEKLAKIFQNMATDIIEKTNVWKVIDPMGPDYISFYGWDINGNPNNPAGISWDNAETFKWDLLNKSVNPTQTGENRYRYTLSYYVKLDTNAKDFVEDKAYPTNDTTTLTYYMGEDDSQTQTVNFKIPKVSGKLPKVSYVIEFYQKDKKTGRYTEVTADEITGTDKLWTVINAPAGYLTKYADDYGFVRGEWNKQPATSMTLTKKTDENVLKLYYDPVETTVIVNHFYKRDTINADGTTTTGVYPAVPQEIRNYPAAGSKLYVGDNFEAPLVPKPEHDLDPDMPNDRDIVLKKTGNVVNLYYKAEPLDLRKSASFAVYHVYNTYRWDIVDGRYVKSEVLGTATLQGSVIENLKATTTQTASSADHNGYAYVKGSAEENNNVTNLVDDYDTRTVTATLGEGLNTVTLTFVKDIPDPEEVTVKVIHRYTKDVTTIGPDGEIIRDTTAAPDKTVTVEEVYYVGETFTVEDFYPTVGDDTYTRTTLDSALTIAKLEKGENTVVVDYELKSEPEKVSLTVKHIYRSWETITVTDELGNESSEIVEIVSERIVVGPKTEGGLYVGQRFTTKLNPNNLTGYTQNKEESSPSNTIIVKGGEELVFVYDKDDIPDRRDEAEIDVSHKYIDKVTYVKYGKQVTEDFISYGYPQSDDTYSGKAGDTFTPAVKTTPYGFSGLYDDGRGKFTLTSGSTGEVTLKSGTNPTIELVYERESDRLIESSLEVTHHYMEQTMTVKDGVAGYYDDPVEVASSTAFTVDGGKDLPAKVYAHEEYTIDAKPENGSTTYTEYPTNAYKVVISEDGSSVDLYYLLKTPLEQYTVTVNHYYELTEISAIGVKKVTDTETLGTPVSKYEGEEYVGESLSKDYTFKSVDVLTADYTQDEKSFDVTVTVDGDIIINFYYEKLIDDSIENEAYYSINHYYRTIDWDEDDSKVYTLDNELGVQNVKSYATLTAQDVAYLKPDSNGSPTYTLDRVESNPDYEKIDENYVITLEVGDDNVINFYYTNRVDTRQGTDITVIHRYWSESAANTAAGKVQEGSKTTVLSGVKDNIWIGNVFAAELDFNLTTGTGAEQVTRTYEFDAAQYTDAMNSENLLRDGSTDKLVAIELSENGNKVITIDYLRTDLTVNYRIVHTYYRGGTLVHTSQPIVVGGQIGDVIATGDISKVPVYDGTAYDYTSTTPANQLVLSENADENVITLRYDYVNRTTSYSIVHTYYRNGTLVHTSDATTVRGTIGDTITAETIAAIEKETEYNGRTYDYTRTTPSDELVLSANAGENVITLRYDYTSTPREEETYTYTVIHRYYTENGSNRSLTGETRSSHRFTDSVTVNTANITRVESYNGNSYDFEDIDPTGTVTFTGDGERIILTYVRELETFEDDTPPLIQYPPIEPPVEIPALPAEPQPEPEPAPVLPPEEEEIIDEEVPLANLPKTGGVAGMGLGALGIAALFGGAALKSKKKEEDEE